MFQQIYKEGARYFWVHNTGPVGCLPFTILNNQRPSNIDSIGCVKSANEVAQELNRQLKNLLLKLRKELPLARITHVDMYSAKYLLISKAKTLGCSSFLKIWWEESGSRLTSVLKLVQVMLIQWTIAVGASMAYTSTVGRKKLWMEQSTRTTLARIHQGMLAGMAYTTLRLQTCGLLTTFWMAHFQTHHCRSTKLVDRYQYDELNHYKSMKMYS